MIPKTPNPWGLTLREGQALSALIEHGSSKAAGRAIGVTSKSIENLVIKAKVRMKVVSRVQAAVQWDRWMRDGEFMGDEQRLVLTDAVVDLVARGVATDPDAMMPHCAGYSRQKVMVAVRNAAQKGRIHLVSRVSRDGAGQRLGVYAIGPKPKRAMVFAPPAAVAAASPVSSVWALGARA